MSSRRVLRNRKERIEWARLEVFLRHFPVAPLDAFRKSEEPDFLVDLPGRVLGIEVTDLHRPSVPGRRPEQESEAMRERVAEAAQELYAKSGCPPVIVNVLFNTHVEVYKKDVDGLAEKIVRIVQDQMPSVDQRTIVRPDGLLRNGVPDSVVSIHITRLDKLTEIRFFVPTSNWVGAMAVDDLSRTIASKEARLDAYRSKCSEVWLVISTDLKPSSTWFDSVQESIPGEYRTGFDKVFVLRHFPNALYELRIQNDGVTGRSSGA